MSDILATALRRLLWGPRQHVEEAEGSLSIRGVGKVGEHWPRTTSSKRQANFLEIRITPQRNLVPPGFPSPAAISRHNPHHFRLLLQRRIVAKRYNAHHYRGGPLPRHPERLCRAPRPPLRRRSLQSYRPGHQQKVKASSRCIIGPE